MIRLSNLPLFHKLLGQSDCRYATIVVPDQVRYLASGFRHLLGLAKVYRQWLFAQHYLPA